MISAAPRPDEVASLAALRALEVLDSENEAPFDALVQAASAVCGTPISLISLIDADRQWFKANLGLPGVSQTPRELAFCAHAVLGDDLFEVSDALQDERFLDNPLVTAAPHIRFYAGMPVRLRSGAAIGTLCVIDHQPRELDERQREVLRHLALAVSQQLEGRLALRQSKAAHKDLNVRLDALRRLFDAVPSLLSYWSPDLICRFANRAYAAFYGLSPDALVGLHLSQLLGPALFELNRPSIEAAYKGQPQTLRRVVPGPGGSTRHIRAHYEPDMADGVFVGMLVEVNDLTSLMLAETRASALEQERDQLARVARLTSNAVLITDLQRRITWVNAGFERLTGYSADEVVGRTPRSLVQFDGTDATTVARLDAAMRAGQAFSCELLNRSKSGRIYWTAKEVQPLLDDAGEQVGFMSIESDITDRVQAEATIRANQSTLETTGRIGGIGGWAFDLKSRRFDLTAQTCHILDLPPNHECTLDDWLHWCAPEARHVLQQAMQRGLTGGPSWDFELPFITAQGRSIWVRLVAECEYADSGALRIVGALQDITARRAIEAAAQRNEALLRGAIDTIDEAFVLYDPEDRLVFCNDKYRTLYATSADLLVPGARFEDIVRTGALRGQYVAAIGRVEEWVAQRMASHRCGNSSLIQKLDDGRTLRIVERHMPDGHVVGFRIDITDLVHATEAAEEGSRAKSDFIATMSHELRTPLQWIIGYAELGEDMTKAAGDAQFASMFGLVLRGGHRMLSLVNDLLDLSAIDGAAMAVKREPQDLRTLAQQVCEELAVLAQARDVRIETAPSLPTLPVDADAGRMQQVLRNVLANAIRFAPAGSVVALDGSDFGPQGVELTVRDEGPGIPPDELEQVFDAFVQSSRTRDGSGGSGLGLTISRRIVTAHGGTLTAENAANAGALLRLRLPMARLQLPRNQPIAPQSLSAPLPALASPTHEPAP